MILKKSDLKREPVAIAALRKELPPEALAAIGFCLVASDKFSYAGDVDPLLANIVAD